MDESELKSLYKNLDKAVSVKDIAALKQYVQNAIESNDQREKRAVYQYAGLFVSEIEAIKTLEQQLK